MWARLSICTIIFTLHLCYGSTITEQVPISSTILGNTRPDTLRLLQAVKQTLKSSVPAKRPFCNSFYGCGNGNFGKRADLSRPEDSIKVPDLIQALAENGLIQQQQRAQQPQRKRAFCNTFYGCGNGAGKRSGAQKVVEQDSVNKPSKPSALLELFRKSTEPVKRDSNGIQKRPFCNAFAGCGNGKKRSLESDVDEESNESDTRLSMRLPKLLLQLLQRKSQDNPDYDDKMSR